jgi:hypothetical protein
MRGLRTDKTAQVIIAGHAFMQNLRRGHHELAVDAPPALGSPQRSPNSPARSDRGPDPGSMRPPIPQRNGTPQSVYGTQNQMFCMRLESV